ncbi:hypothetical protein ACFLYF_01280 [Chloroflexota bacterium]
MSHRLPEMFIPFLDSLGFKSDGIDTPLVQLWQDKPSVTASGNEDTIPAVHLYQRSETQVTIVGFRQKLLQWLREANHVANEAVVDAILGCVIGAASSGSERAAFLENALAQFRKAEVSHFFVLPNKAIAKPMDFDGYCLGEINLPVLASRCRRAGSDFAQLYGEKLSGRFALQTPDFKHVVIDFLKLGYDSKLTRYNSPWRDLLLHYFEQISRQHFEFMWGHLNRTQVLCAPFNANCLDVENMRSEMGRFAQRITIYLEFSRAPSGYVVPEGGGLILNQPGPDSESFKRFLAHRQTYRLFQVGDSELGRIIHSCAGFCQQAIRFLESGRYDDAALYATICLEHLFSEQQSTAEAVCTRTAALTHLRVANSYSEAQRELRKLYDTRSRFVHSGESVTPTRAECLVAYATETLRSLLVLHLKSENRSQGFLEKWVKNLDFIAAGFEASSSFEGSFLADNGVF